MMPLPPSFSASALAPNCPPSTLSEATSADVCALLTPRSTAMTGMPSLFAARTEGPAASESTGLTTTADRPPLTKFCSWLACWEASFWASVTVRSTPSFFASSSAPFLICTKNGLLSVDSDSPIFWSLPPEEPLCSSEVAPTTATATTAAIT